MTTTITAGQPERDMRAALNPVLAAGPTFLAGEMHADDMASTMMQAVQDFLAKQPTPGVVEKPMPGTEAATLYSVLAEVQTCGAGYLAHRCDADCVARTMTQIVAEFGS